MKINLKFGNWKDMEHIFFSNSDRYEGKFVNGIYNGYGIFYSNFGFKYKSYFKDSLFMNILITIYKILIFI